MALRIGLLASLLGLAPGPLLRIPPQEVSRTRVVFHESPAIDLYFHVRVSEAAAKAEPFAAAAGAARAIDRQLGGQTLAWGPLDGLLPGCATVADIQKAFEGVPAELTLRGGTKLALREPALELASALAPAEAAFAPLWEARRAKLLEGRALWERAVGPKESQLFAQHLAALGMQDQGLALPVYLVTEDAWPGAHTVFDSEHRGVSFVAAGVATGSTFLEIVLHEVTHSLDIAAGERSALGELRAKMAKAGLDRNRRLGDPAHALMFVQSAESIRRGIDPAHVDYGETEKVYERLGQTATIVRGFWRDHLEGKLTREEALDGIVEGLAAGSK